MQKRDQLNKIFLFLYAVLHIFMPVGLMLFAFIKGESAESAMLFLGIMFIVSVLLFAPMYIEFPYENIKVLGWFIPYFVDLGLLYYIHAGALGVIGILYFQSLILISGVLLGYAIAIWLGRRIKFKYKILNGSRGINEAVASGILVLGVGFFLLGYLPLLKEVIKGQLVHRYLGIYVIGIVATAVFYAIEFNRYRNNHSGALRKDFKKLWGKGLQRK